MYDIKFKDDKGNIFTYTTYSAKDEFDAKILWDEYIDKHFNCYCEIIDCKKVI